MRKLSFGIVIAIVLTVLIWALWPTKAKELAIKPAPVETPATSQKQKELDALNAFFAKHKCPEPYYSNDYIANANKYSIPYALLPAISIAESQCGRHQLYNNWFGFWSDKKGFASVATGVDYVSFQLADGRPYKNKTLEQKIKTYNSANKNYYNEIIGLMNQITR